MSQQEHPPYLLHRLRVQYSEQLSIKLQEIVDSWRAVQHAGVVNSGYLQELANCINTLSGSASKLGYAAFSEVAQCFEIILRSYDDSESCPIAPLLAEQMESFLSRLEQAQRLVDERLMAEIEIDKPAFSLPSAMDMARERSQAVVYLLEANADFAQELCLEMGINGFRVSHFAQADAFIAAVDEQTPNVIILNTASDGSQSNGFDLIATLQNAHQLTVPTVFLTESGNFQERLNAVRSGAAHCFVKPVDFWLLARALDGLVSGYREVPYRILVVQNNTLSTPYSQWMEEEGMVVIAAENAESILALLDEQHPELLLIDLQMTEYSGTEIAAVIHQLEDYADIPILFVSEDSSEEKQIRAMYQQGDEFLVKPVSRVRLIESIKARVQHYRNLRLASRQMQLAVNELRNFKHALDQHAIVSITDREGFILYANQKFCQISGYSHEELIGRHHRIIKGDMQPEVYTDMWQTIASGREWRGEVRNKRKDGCYYWVESSVMPLGRDANGAPERYIAVRTDVTDLKEAQQALVEKDERYRRSQRYANMGTWDWDISAGKVICSEWVSALFSGVEGVASLSFKNFMGQVYEDDRDSVTATITQCLDSGVPLDLEHRVKWFDDSIHWLHHQGDVVRSAEGQPLHLLGVVTEVTRRKQAEETLFKQKDLLEVLRQAVLRYIGDEPARSIATYLLRALVDLTSSEYGLLSEVKLDGCGVPYLHMLAMHDANQDNASLVNQGNAVGDESGVELCNLDMLLGNVLTTGVSVFCNNLPADPMGSGLLPAQRPLEGFLGVPVFHDGRLVAMYGIANSKQGYNAALLEFLRPFDATVAAVVDAMRRTEDRLALLDQLMQTKEEAERANGAKTEFLSRMSHELRTPLNAVLGFAQLLDSDTDEPLTTSQKESVDQILSAGWHLLRLINEVLDLSRIESGNLLLELRDIAFKPLLDECISLLEPMAAEKQINLMVDTASACHCLIRVDETRLKQVLLNLLSNAIKYNHENGSVRVTYTMFSGQEYVHDYLRVSVIDSGIGLTDEQQTHLFEAFNRVGAERTSIEGTGIGLVIVKRLVEKMGGEIGVHSRPDEGSTFWVDLPCSDVIVNADDLSATSSVPGQLEQLSEDRFKVLYIEDNIANRLVVERILERQGAYELITAPDAELGVELARGHQPDLILMDINLPGMDGYAALKYLRANKETQHIPVVAFSANAMQSDISRGLSAGFDAYLAKPVKVDEVFAMLRRYLPKGGQ